MVSYQDKCHDLWVSRQFWQQREKDPEQIEGEIGTFYGQLFLLFSFIVLLRSIFHVQGSLMMLVVPKTSLSVLNVLVYGCLHLSKMYRVFKAFESRQVKLIFNWISRQKQQRTDTCKLPYVTRHSHSNTFLIQRRSAGLRL